MDAQEFIKKNWYKAALLLILLIVVWYRFGILDSYVIPTYGNTMYHVGIERETINTGHYPDYELSYGGGFPHFYVPAFRLLVVSMSLLTGIDPMIMSGLMTIVLAVFVCLTIYVLALLLSNNLYIALFSAFFFLMSPDLTVFTMRALPELLGLVLMPLTFYFVIKKEWGMAMLAAAMTALTHQMTLLTCVGVIACYAAFKLLHSQIIEKKFKFEPMFAIPSIALWAIGIVIVLLKVLTFDGFMLMFRTLYGMIIPVGGLVDIFVYGTLLVLALFALACTYALVSAAHASYKSRNIDQGLLALLPAISACVTYGVWQFYSLGTLSLSGLQQVSLKEGSPVDVAAFVRAGIFVIIFALIGVIFLYAYKHKKESEHAKGAAPAKSAVAQAYDLVVSLDSKLFMLAWLVVTIVLSKNELLNIHIFMDRFFTFLIMAMVILAGYGMYGLLTIINLKLLKEKPE